MKHLLNRIVDFIYPRLCCHCGRALCAHEKGLCTHCLYALPEEDITSYTANSVIEQLAGRLPLVKAAVAYRYGKESVVQSAFEAFKYHGQRELADLLTVRFCPTLQRGGFFDGIDVIVPVPLHPKKRQWRGYNQSECIAAALSKASGLPVDETSLQRVRRNESQTKHNRWQRQLNSSGLFELQLAHRLQEKQHVLLVDDVLTTGATLEACGRALLHRTNCRLSVFALART